MAIKTAWRRGIAVGTTLLVSFAIYFQFFYINLSTCVGCGSPESLNRNLFNNVPVNSRLILTETDTKILNYTSQKLSFHNHVNYKTQLYSAGDGYHVINKPVDPRHKLREFPAYFRVPSVTTDDFTATELEKCQNNMTCTEDLYANRVIENSLKKNASFWRFWVTESTPFTADYVIDSALGCPTSGKILVVYIHSSLEHFVHRELIRRTWGSVRHYRQISIALLFQVGSRENRPLIQKRVLKEAFMYGDIVQGDYKDSYRNLTLKNIFGLKWIHEHCQHSTYVMKADDDVLVNIFRIIDYILDVAPLEGEPMMICSRVVHNHKVNRNVRNKQYTTFKENPQYLYPSFCIGRTYIMRTRVAMQIYVLSSRLRRLWVDDVWVTGIVGTLVGARRLRIPYSQLKMDSLTKDHQYCLLDIHPINMTLGLTAWNRGITFRSQKSQSGASWNGTPCRASSKIKP